MSQCEWERLAELMSEEEIGSYLSELNTYESVAAINLIDDLKREIVSLKEYIHQREPEAD